MDNPAKVNDLEIALWAFKNVQNITGSTIKTFLLKKQHKPSLNLNFHVVVVVVAVVDIICIEYFLSEFFPNFIKVFENLWKWFEFIHFSFLVKTYVFQFSLYMHMLLPLKMGVCCIYAYSLFVWDSRDIRDLYFSIFFIGEIHLS